MATRKKLFGKIPPPGEVRAEIAKLSAELSVLRRLLKAAETKVRFEHVAEAKA